MVIQIRHDPFARTSLVREVVEDNKYTCTWCGSGYRLRHKLFRYGTERDDKPGINWHPGQFCNKTCHDSFHS